MSDEHDTFSRAEQQAGGPEAAEPDGAAGAEVEDRSEAAAAWREVLDGLESLGVAIGRWTKAAVDDPENRERADELSDKLEGFVTEVGSTVKRAVDSEVGESFREAAGKTGEAFRQAGERISEEVGPKLAGAFKSAATRLGEAAQRMEDRAATTSDGDTSQTAED